MPTSLTAKLGIKPGVRMLLLDAPADVREAIAPLPEGARVQTKGDGPFDSVMAFVRTQADVVATAPRVLEAVRRDGMVWFAYPKRTAGIATDLHRDAGWQPVREAGWDTVAIVAVDGTWSALRFRQQEHIGTRSKPAAKADRGR